MNIKPKHCNIKKGIFGSLVGDIIVFVWQAASWMFLGIHSNEEKYTLAQDQISATLKSSNFDDRMYMIPPAPTTKEQQEIKKQNQGKPWARIFYGNSMSTSMTTPMIMGFVVDLILVIFLISILVRVGLPNFTGIFTGVIAVGLFTFPWEPYREQSRY